MSSKLREPAARSAASRSAGAGVPGDWGSITAGVAYLRANARGARAAGTIALHTHTYSRLSSKLLRASLRVGVPPSKERPRVTPSFFASDAGEAFVIVVSSRKRFLFVYNSGPVTTFARIVFLTQWFRPGSPRLDLVSTHSLTPFSSHRVVRVATQKKGPRPTNHKLQ